MINVTFFAKLKEDLGCESTVVDLPEGSTAEQLKAALIKQNPQWEQPLDNSALLVAVNQTITDWETVISPADEVAFFPPVTGG